MSGIRGELLTLDDLQAFNEELAAMVRAGVPLELGLGTWRSGLRGQLARVVERLAERLREGKSLPEAMAGEGTGFPGLYPAVVSAGLRAGRLPETLE